MKIYGDAQSGNCYKIKLLTSILNIKHEWIELDILAKQTHTADFLQKNPNGKIPLLELDDGRCLSESNAILNYLSQDTVLAGSDGFNQAKILQWQFFEQYSHEPYIAVARFIAKYLGLPDDKKDEFKSKQAGGHKALGVMEAQLKTSDYLAGNTLSIADISLYGYTHVAHEGGFDLAHYPAIQKWIKRIQSHELYVAMA